MVHPHRSPSTQTEQLGAVTILEGGLVMTMDAERRMIEGGAVAFDESGRILAVGPLEEVRQALGGIGEEDARGHRRRTQDRPSQNQPVSTKESSKRSDVNLQSVDCRRCVLLPGFVDAHVHLGEHVMRGLVPDDAPPSEWLPKWLLPAYAALSGEDESLSAQLAFAEALLSGTTTVAEAGTLLEWEPVARAAIACGIRAQLGRWTWDLPDVPPRMRRTTKQAVEGLEELLSGVARLAEPRISGAVTLLGMGTASEELMREAAGLSGSLDVPLATMHASIPREHCGAPMPIRQLGELGWITERTKLVHSVYVESDEIGLLADGGVSVVHCPSAALRHAKGLGRYGRFFEMLEAGIPVGLGGDSANGSNHLRMNELMWLASALPKDALMQTNVGEPETALEMATVHGARCLGLHEEIGSLEVGKRADIVAFSMEHPEWHPMLHPVQNLVLSVGASSVESVWVDGKQLVSRGSLLSVDLVELLSRVEEASRSLLSRTGLQVTTKWPWISR